VHAPYCHLWPVTDGNIFPHYLIKDTILEKKKKIIEHEICVLGVSINLYKIFIVLRRIERDMMENVCWSSCKVLFILGRF